MFKYSVIIIHLAINSTTWASKRPNPVLTNSEQSPAVDLAKTDDIKIENLRKNASQYLEKRDYKNAIQLWNQILRHPEHDYYDRWKAYYILVDTHKIDPQKNRDTATRILERIVQDPECSFDDLRRVTIEYTKGVFSSPSRAAELWDRVLVHSQNIEDIALAAHTHFKSKNLNRAHVLFESLINQIDERDALNQIPSLTRAVFLSDTALIAENCSLFSVADSLWRKLLQLSLQEIDLSDLREAADFYERMENFGFAIEIMERLILITPNELETQKLEDKKQLESLRRMNLQETQKIRISPAA